MRRKYIDYLKALACITIVVLHVIVNPIDRLSFSDPNYYILYSLSHLTRWAVPVFTMVSGCNLLGRENAFDSTRKHIIHILRIAVFWGIIYASADPIIDILVGKSIEDPMQFIRGMFHGRAYHLWYCFMIAGLYALIPLLNPIVSNKRTCKYFIIICLISSIILPGLSYLGEYVRPIGTVVEHLRFPVLGLYICYFALGYYIDRYMEDSKTGRYMLYAFALFILGIEIISGIIYGMYFEQRATVCADLTALLTATAIFVWFKFDFKPGKCYPFIAKITTESLGIYLMHPYLIIRLSMKGFNSVMLHPLLAVPLVSFLVVIVCFIASRLLRKIPQVGKWLL